MKSLWILFIAAIVLLAPAERHVAMTWAQRLKRVFGIDIETCQACGSAMKVIPKALAVLAGQALACIEDPRVNRKILDHLDRLAATTEANALPASFTG